MADPVIKSSEFDEFLAPLYLICNITYQKVGLGKVLQLKNDYKEDVQKNQEALENLKSIIKLCIKEVIQSLALNYRNKLKQIYSDDGIITLIDYTIKQEMQDSLS